ncbi:MAG: fructose-1,6-bisphosphatase [Clostridia bacterium]|nr:fructose-1,6-bisphosphatase [Clostridia bacterium]
MNKQFDDNYYKFLKLLSREYPDIAKAAAEIINLNAILNLPKGTEHFMSDIHGEYEAFTHILKNGSGVVRKKIEERLGKTVTEAERAKLATLIYYPEKKLRMIKEECSNMEDWYTITIYRLVEVCRYIASKYTRSKVRKSMPQDYAYILDELLNIPADGDNKEDYYSEIINSIISTDSADDIIAALSHLISRLCIDRLHIVGDIYDRGPGAEIIMDTLCDYHSVDIQWGNHDILWMGAAAGNEACIANVIRMCTRYNNTDTLEAGYGISLRPVSTFASTVYADDPCTNFMPIDYSSRGDNEAVAKINKAITVIQLKLEGQLIRRNPNYEMEDRLLLGKIDLTSGTVEIDGKLYELTDTNFPTIDADDPYRLTEGEETVVKKMHALFAHSERLHKHIKFLYDNGAMYTRYNGNLLYHGCIPLTEQGEFMTMKTCDGDLSGRALLDYCDRMARKAYFGKNDEAARDFMWYLWCGKMSPLFGKNKMTTFERCFTSDEDICAEHKNNYYKLYENEDICNKIIEEFGLDISYSHIINGHVPVRIKKGESPIKGGGKLLVIDGGLSKPYQTQTGIAGYTLIYNSYGLHLVTHEPFESVTAAIEQEKDIHSVSDFIEKTPTRLYIADTDNGKEIARKIDDLKNLIDAYRSGSLA